MRAGLRVRTAAAADVDGLAELASATVTSGRARAPFDRRTRYEQLLETDSGVALVAEDTFTGQMIGLLTGGTGEIGPTTPVPALVVTELLVRPSHRRRGVGRALLAGAVRTCDERGLDNVVVSVATGDRQANRYLARLGFTPLVVRRVAPTAVLRRSLVLAEGVSRARIRRQMLRSVPLTRPAGRQV